MRITNVTRGTELASDAWQARSLVQRTLGLLGHSSLQAGEALVLKPCNSVHTAFMRFAIDVVYVDGAGRVVKAAPKLKPFRLSGLLRPSCSVIELPSGTLERTATEPGDQLVFED